MRQVRVGRANVVDIESLGAGDVTLQELGVAVTVGGRQVKGGVDDTHLGIVKMSRQPFGRDQGFGVGI